MSLTSNTLGRLSAEEVAAGVPFDAPEKTVRAMLTQLDSLVDALKQLKADAYASASGVDDAIDALTKLELRQ